MMLRIRMLSVCCAVALATATAFAMPFTNAFDDISGEITAQLAAPGELSKAQSKALTKAEKAIGKTSTNLKKDLSTGKKVNKLEKKFDDDAGIESGLDSMVDGLVGAVGDRIAEVADIVGELPTGKADAARRNLTQAQDFLATAGSAETRKNALKFATKAISKAEAAAKKAAKAGGGGGGGGGGGNCPNLPAIGANESGSVALDNVNKPLGGLSSRVRQNGDVAEWVCTLFSCQNNGNDYVELELSFPGDPPVGQYLVSPVGGTGGAFLLRDASPGAFGQLLGGALEITSNQGGLISGTFTTGPVGSPRVDATFTANNPFTQ